MKKTPLMLLFSFFTFVAVFTLWAEEAKISVFVLSDRGDPASMTGDQYKNRIQVGEFMEKDLINILKDEGYEAAIIEKPEDFAPGPGKYLLKVAIKNYNPGSKAARLFVGYGAGATSLDTHYELSSDGADPLISGDPGVGSSRDWRNCVEKVNRQTLDKIKETLKGSRP